MLLQGRTALPFSYPVQAGYDLFLRNGFEQGSPDAAQRNPGIENLPARSFPLCTSLYPVGDRPERFIPRS